MKLLRRLLQILLLGSVVAAQLHFASPNTTCADIVNVPVSNQCKFASTYCDNEDYHIGIFDYMVLFFCSKGISVPISLAILSLAVCFLGLGLTASSYLSPNLYTISKLLNISDGLAGLTLMAIGNSSADVFSTYKALSIDAAGLALSELLGAAFFVLTVVIGTICIARPFESGEIHIFRDALFYFIIMCFMAAIIISGKITLIKSVCLFSLYVVYVVLVFYSHVLIQKNAQREPRDSQPDVILGTALLDSFGQEDHKIQQEVDTFLATHDISRLDDIAKAFDSNKLRIILPELGKHTIHGAEQNYHSVDEALSDDDRLHLSTGSISPFSQTTESNKVTTVSVKDTLLKFIPSVNEDASWLTKLSFAICFPLRVAFNFTIPIRQNAITVGKSQPDDEHEAFSIIEDSFDINLDLKLYQIQIVSSLMFAMSSSSTLLSFLMTYWPIVIVVLLFFSHIFLPSQLPQQDKMTNYCWWNYIGTFLGFANAMRWISIFGSEIIGILKAIATAFRIKDDILGFTVFAIGNSIGDLVANLTIAWMGMPMMAFGACFGSPLLSLCAMGFSSAVIILKSDISYIPVHFSPTLFLNLSSLLLALGFLVTASWINPNLGRAAGCILLLMWVCTIIVTLILEINHTFLY